MEKFYSTNFIFMIFILCAFMMLNQKPKYKIICIGDSITYGAGVEGNGWVEQIAKKSDKILMVNEGRKGRRTSDKEEIIPILERNLDSDLVLLLLGVNDLKNGNDSLVSSCVSNMKWIITQIKEKMPKAKIVLMAPCNINIETMSEINRQKKYNENTVKSLAKLEIEYKKLAEEENIGFISLFNAVSPQNFLDGLHPNIDGYKEIADIIWKEINSIFKYE